MSAAVVGRLFAVRPAALGRPLRFTPAGGLDALLWRGAPSPPLSRGAGHSKWAKIARGKGANDAERAVRFTKAARVIAAAVRAGGPDAASNLALASALEAAKRAGLPKENIERAVRGRADGPPPVAFTFEAVGPGGVGFMIDTLAENRQRVTSNIRSYFNKAGGELAAAGAVAYRFTERGRVDVVAPRAGDGSGDADSAWASALLDAAAAAGGEDVDAPDDDADADAADGDDEGRRTATVWCAPADVDRVRAALARGGYAVARAARVRVPSELTEVSEGDAERLATLLAKLEGDEDVVAGGVWHTAAG